jgi:type I restriction enzyme S subunit
MVVFKETFIERELLFYILMSSHIQAEIKTLNKGSALPTVTQESIGSIEIFTPPRNEQLKMIEHVKNQEARLFALIDQSESSMRLLLERRSTLISAAVTGQIDIRGLVETRAGN